MGTIFILLFIFSYIHCSYSQQSYVNNKQLDCYVPNNSTNGNLCNGVQTSCPSYLTFRSQLPYDSASDIGQLLNSDPSQIAELNNITDVDTIPTDKLIIVPIINCTCSGKFYQYNSNYTLKYDFENYFTLANNSYQGLTTCQALMNENPMHDSRNLSIGMHLSVPIRCACPTKNQTDDGVKYLLSYLVDWGDTITSISNAFGVGVQSTLDANELAFDDLIFPFTPIIVPLKKLPVYKLNARPPPAAQPPTIPLLREDDAKSSDSKNKKWVFIGIGIGLFFFVVAILGLLCFFLCRRPPKTEKLDVTTDYIPTPEKESSSLVSSKNIRDMIDSSFNVYDFEELQRATEYFNEDNRIKGSVYRGVIKGDNAAIKRMKGDVVNEINILKQINHTSVVRLSGYCMHEGSAYFVYEFLEHGSLSDWLHEDKSCDTPDDRLSWKQRVQIAYDVADGLNYLHNYATPPYIHKDLRSSNILLDGHFRAKIANFGMARTKNNTTEEENVLQMTRHVVGTQGYMAPEYMENGVVTPKMDVFAFGVVMLELLSGKEAVTFSNTDTGDGKVAKGDDLLSACIYQVLEGENVREKLKSFIDPSLESEYPLDLTFSMAQLAMNCVAKDLNSRPTMFDVFVYLSKILSSSLDWDPSYEAQRTSMVTL